MSNRADRSSGIRAHSSRTSSRPRSSSLELLTMSFPPDVTPPSLPSASPATIPGRHGSSPRSVRTMSAVIGLSLAAVGTAIYLSPAPAAHSSASADHLAARPTPDGRSTILSLTPAPAAAASTPYLGGPTGTGARQIKYVPVYNTYRGPGTTIEQRTVVYVPVPRTSTAPGSHSTVTVTPTPKRLYCSNFQWQQDAQAAYIANLSDPWGLDGAPGPHNGDGLACTQLPVDPTRAASRAVDAYDAPGPAEKQMLVQPATRYFGVSQ